MNSTKIRTIATLVGIATVLGAVSFWIGQQAYNWFPPQASAESIEIDKLFSFLVTIAAFIFLGVSGTLIYSALFQRAGKYDSSDGPPIEGNLTLEVVWTAIPFVLVIWIATYSFQIYDRLSIIGPMEHNHAMAAATRPESVEVGASRPEPVEQIEVLSRQWAWEFHYPKHDVSSTELHLPKDQRVQLVLQSEDVLHGLYIPAFRLKQDIVPNERINFEMTPIREGIYRLRDSQYSGTYFAAMQANVVVESPEAYQRWLKMAAAQPPQVAYNQAYDEYEQASRKTAIAGWKSIPPAPPPVVNYPGPKASED
ncbi:MAG: cytochrome c oxidase subunit II [Cyanobacteria bacterium J06626_18]